MHPATIGSRNNLAAAYYRAGRVAESVPLLEQTVAERAAVLGDGRRETLTARANLARAYRGVGRRGDAIRLFEQAHAGMAASLGPDHPDTRGVRAELTRARRSRRSLRRSLSDLG